MMAIPQHFWILSLDGQSLLGLSPVGYLKMSRKSYVCQRNKSSQCIYFMLNILSFLLLVLMLDFCLAYFLRSRLRKPCFMSHQVFTLSYGRILFKKKFFLNIIRMLANIHQYRENNSIMNLHIPSIQLQQLPVFCLSCFICSSCPLQFFMEEFYCNTI